MGFDVGKKGSGVKPEINVTPLVDVVLVLLIIFMVITPLLTKRFQVLLPTIQDGSNAPPSNEKPEPPIVVTLNASGEVKLLGELVSIEELPERVASAIAGRKDPVVFFDSADQVSYGEALHVIDVLRDGGSFGVAILTEPMLGK